MYKSVHRQRGPVKSTGCCIHRPVSFSNFLFSEPGKGHNVNLLCHRLATIKHPQKWEENPFSLYKLSGGTQSARGLVRASYFRCFLKILKVCFLRLAVESVSSPVEPLSSSSGLFLDDSCGMRVAPLAGATPGCAAPVGDGVSGSVELGLSERDDSERLFMSPMLGDVSTPCTLFMRMGLSHSSSEGLSSCTRLPPLGVCPCSEAAMTSSPRPDRPCTSEVGFIRWPLEP